MRVAAATLLELEGSKAASTKEALETVVASLPGAGLKEALARVSDAREKRVLPPGVAGPTLFHLIEVARAMRARVSALS